MSINRLILMLVGVQLGRGLVRALAAVAALDVIARLGPADSLAAFEAQFDREPRSSVR